MNGLEYFIVCTIGMMGVIMIILGGGGSKK